MLSGTHFRDFFIGASKLLVILSPLWLPALFILSGTGDCRGDCGVGIGMLIVIGAAVFGPALVGIGLPIVIGLLIWWTRGRAAQLLGGVTFIPLILIAWWSFSHVRDAASSSKIEAEIRPEYLSRAVSDPVGKLDLLVIVGEGGACLDKCYEVLVDGIAQKYSNGYLNDKRGTDELFEKIYTLASGESCRSDDNATVSSIGYMQSRGIFDRCIVRSQVHPPISAVALRGFNSDRETLVRPHGLRSVMVIQALMGRTLGKELVRWEYGSLPGTKKPIGVSFGWTDLIRAYTGITTDRFADAQKLDLGQRMDAILQSEKIPALQLYPVFYYLRAAPRRELTSEDIAKLRAIGEWVCSATPVVEGYYSKPIDCRKGYNDLVSKAYPSDAETLMLTTQKGVP